MDYNLLMKNLKIILLMILIVSGIIIATLYFTGYFNPKGAGIFIETSPVSNVYINGEQVGKTPYKEIHDPGDIVVKLVPESFDIPLAPYETSLRLVPGVETVVTREFGESDDMSSGEVVSFEEVASDETSVAIVSIPDTAQVSIDGVVQGHSPYKTSTITESDHTITVSSPGYIERNIDITPVKGYMLTAFVQLLPDPEAIVQEEENDEPILEVYEVKILSTPVGYLRVRDIASTAGEEVGRVDPDETYPFVEEDEDSGWVKIEYEDGKEGWVSGDYAEKVEIGEEDSDDNGSADEES